jgi:hypothetical protein
MQLIFHYKIANDSSFVLTNIYEKDLSMAEFFNHSEHCLRQAFDL